MLSVTLALVGLFQLTANCFEINKPSTNLLQENMLTAEETYLRALKHLCSQNIFYASYPYWPSTLLSFMVAWGYGRRSACSSSLKKSRIRSVPQLLTCKTYTHTKRDLKYPEFCKYQKNSQDQGWKQWCWRIILGWILCTTTFSS